MHVQTEKAEGGSLYLNRWLRKWVQFVFEFVTVKCYYSFDPVTMNLPQHLKVGLHFDQIDN